MLVLFGATGFTGKKAAAYLRDHAPEGLAWAIAARNPAKLQEVHDELGLVDVPQIVADSGDPASIDAMVAQASVVISTVGPFAKYGTPLVEACVRHGVHYADITGETPWVRDLIDAFHEDAAAVGARIVPCCGFDSVPSDIGAMFVADHIREALRQGTTQVRCAYTIKGGISGGTVASALNMGESGENRRLADPLLLNPDSHRSRDERSRNRDQFKASYDDALRTWTTPFIMAAVNTRVVRRSAALRDLEGAPYGPGFRYSESMRASSRLKAVGMAAGVGVFAALTTNRPGRALIERIAPDPGEGPGEEALENGFLRGRYVGVAEDGSHVFAELMAKGDPGYKVTITFLCEAGLAMALDESELPGGEGRGGVLTPATGLGHRYLERLRAQGITLEVRAT